MSKEANTINKLYNLTLDKSFANKGVHFLTDTNPAPVGSYSGFVILNDTVIASITTNSDITGDITAVIFTSGYIPIEFSTITLTSGTLMLIKA